MDPMFVEARKQAYAQARAALDGKIGQDMLGKFASKNLHALAWGENGFRHMTNNKRAVASPDDLKGLKMRTMENPVHMQAYKAFGIIPTPMAFTEVYTALESKALDGQETPYNIIYTSRFFEVQKYLSATKHIYGPGVLLVGRKFWDQLSGDEKKVLQDSCSEARDFERKASHDLDARVLAEMKAKGMQINDVAPQERARMRDAVKPVVEKYTAVIGADLVKQAYAEIERVRKQP
jgi:tripartite ATP-independent transporter DctP family solute receptor